MHGQYCDLQVRNVLEQLFVALVFVRRDAFSRLRNEYVEREGAQPVHDQEDDDEDDGLDFDFGELFADFDLFDLFVEVGVLDFLFQVLICTEGGVVLEGLDVFHAEFLLTHLLVFFAQVDEQLHCVLRVTPCFFYICV